MADLSEMAMMHAMFSDEKMRERMVELNAKLEELGKAELASKKSAEEAKAAWDALAAEKRQVEALRADIGTREAKLQTDTAALASANASMNAEKERFNAVRAQAEKDHTEREAAVAAREKAADELTADATRRAAALASREAVAAAADVVHAKRREAAQAFLGVA